MGFDPRRWRPPAGSPPVTSNVETLLAENDALRREVRALRQRLAQLQQGSRGGGGFSHGLSAELVERWGAAMARHSRWSSLRIGPPGGLRGLVDALPPLPPDLGAELAAALRGPHSRSRWAVRAAFALYGQRAPEWLNDAPLRVVDELLRRVEPANHSQQRRRGTRTANHSQARPASPGASATADPRVAALGLLGLEPGASATAIKRAYRRLAKAHHPDLGGDVAAFHRLDAAYRLLIG